METAENFIELLTLFLDLFKLHYFDKTLSHSVRLFRRLFLVVSGGLRVACNCLCEESCFVVVEVGHTYLFDLMNRKCSNW